MYKVVKELILKKPFISERLILTSFSDEHLTEKYVSWLNDSDVVRFSEQRHLKHTKQICLKYINSFKITKNKLLVIIIKKSKKHIGNLSINIDLNNQLAEMNIIIGDKSEWGNGYGSEAWGIILDYLIKDIKIRKVIAGAMTRNEFMIKIFKKHHMTMESIKPREYLLNGEEVDLIYYAKYS